MNKLKLKVRWDYQYDHNDDFMGIETFINGKPVLMYEASLVEAETYMTAFIEGIQYVLGNDAVEWEDNTSSHEG